MEVVSGTTSSECICYFFPKKDMILPWPFFVAPFLSLDVLAAVGAWTLAFFGAGSSSEKDSQTASSLVTAAC